MPTPTIYYIRHGETSWNAEGRLQGTRDIALNDLGRRQAAQAGGILAQLLARDGEGASKFVTINVGGASSNGAARKIGLSVANSPLVKTAIAGEDANWGRIVMAVGKSGERADRDKLRISMGGVRITDGGQVLPTYDETPVVKHLKGTDIVIDIDLGIGRGRATVWTCDLTHGYIDINGSYRS